MPTDDTIRILARWIAELQVDLAELRVRTANLEQRILVADDVRWWIERHTPNEVRELAEAIA
jgi:hypothetical protein